jgi:nitroreductase
MDDPTVPRGLDPAQLRAAVDWAITSRRSVRAFLPTPVPRAELEAILAVASRAPSGTNTQPWKVHVVTGEAKARLSAAILEAFDDPAAARAHTEEYDYYPRQWVSPYVERRRKVGLDLYGLLGIRRGDAARMHAQFARNYRFFDAPVGLFLTIGRIMGRGSLIDAGAFLQSLMVAARGRGLDTCPQAAFTQFHRIVEAQLGIGEDQLLLCGMSLGHADPAAPENRLVTEREPVAAFATFHC